MEDKRLLRRTAIVIAVLNLTLALAKTVTWTLTDSLAIQSEAVNSWIDTVYSLLILIGVVLSTREPNEKFPEGHHRIEPFVSVVIGVAILATSIAVGFSALSGLSKPSRQLFQIEVGFTVLVLSAVVKYVMYRISEANHHKTNSPVLDAIATDSRNDILTVLVAFVGIIGYKIGLPFLDAVAAILVALAIGYSGLDIVRNNIYYIIGTSISDDEKKEIVSEVLQNKRIEGIHDVSIHYTGSKIDVSMHLEVDGGITVEEAHEIETSIGDQIESVTYHSINEINLHIDPKSLNEWEGE